MSITITNYNWLSDEESVQLFITNQKMNSDGFRRNVLSVDQWNSFLERPQIRANPFIAIQRDGSTVNAVIVPHVRTSAVYLTNAFLHLFGNPSEQMFSFVIQQLRDFSVARFCQTLIPSTSKQAISIALRAGGIHSEDEISMTRPYLPIPCDSKEHHHQNLVLIQPGTAGDIDRINNIHSDCFVSDIAYSERDFSGAVNSSNSDLLVAKKDEVLCGFIETTVEGERQWIDTMAVAQRYRRQGYATAMLSAALSAATPGMASRLNVSSRNTAAVTLYQKFFYEESFRDCRVIFLMK
jgi:GNAT superfamily N-acetyltransferase